MNIEEKFSAFIVAREQKIAQPCMGKPMTIGFSYGDGFSRDDGFFYCMIRQLRNQLRAVVQSFVHVQR